MSSEKKPLSTRDAEKLMEDPEEQAKADARQKEKDERLAEIKSSDSVTTRFLRCFDGK
jgi:hypothetical protein